MVQNEALIFKKKKKDPNSSRLDSVLAKDKVPVNSEEIIDTRIPTAIIRE